ncbi:unnamed protein product [Danaus chrysippus]|uniref:(African queen) hypothetical protein n=1 Tax=Danaus chrysippus TaxID=151541 RepID=A0A8J2QGV1_9NEOP|nr:unnamed protein product [Danaus chrysippus]
MENIDFSEKIEKYFSELGRWKVWRGIILGQVLSLLLSGKCILTTLLQSATWQFPTNGQLVIPYFVLFILFSPSLLCRGLTQLTKKWWLILIACILDLLACSGVGAALVGGAWRGQRLGVAHVAGATLGLMAVVCVVWADVEGAPTDGKNQLVGDMLCLAGSLLYALVTVLQEIMLKTHSCAEYLALLGFIGSLLSCSQTFFLEFSDLMTFNWYELDTIIQLGSYCVVQTIFQILQSFMLRDAGSIILHLSFLSSDYYTLIAGMFIFQFKFHALYFLSYFLAMVGVFLFSARRTSNPVVIPQIIHDSVQTQDNVSMEYTVPALDCIPLSEGLEPPMSRDTTFTSFLGGPQTANTMPNGNMSFGPIITDETKEINQDINQ